ncbi:MAG: cell division protein FtsB [bacterium]|jgi:cell division protein FtsB
MKVFVVVLLVLLAALQWRLWFGDGSLQELSRLSDESAQSRSEVLKLTVRNQALAAEVADLKSGLDAIEERARGELGMINEGETFYRFIREKSTNKNPPLPEMKTSDGGRS